MLTEISNFSSIHRLVLLPNFLCIVHAGMIPWQYHHFFVLSLSRIANITRRITVKTFLHTLGLDQSSDPTCIIACHDRRQHELDEIERKLAQSADFPHKVLRPYGGPIGLAYEKYQPYWQDQVRTSLNKALYFRYLLIGHTGSCRHCEENNLFPSGVFCEYVFWGKILSIAEEFLQGVAKQCHASVVIESFLYDLESHTLIPVYRGVSIIHRHESIINAPTHSPKKIELLQKAIHA